MTHDISSMLAENEPCMCGRATLVMLVSSTCITVTIITENVMAHLRAEPRGAVGASATIVCRGPLHLEDVVHVGVKISGQAADRMEPVQVDAAGGGVVQAVADVEVDDLTDHEIGRRVANRDDPDQPALHADGRLVTNLRG